MSENLARHFLLREDVVFLNHGSYGACPRPVFEAYQRWQLELERQPVAFFDPARGATARMRDTRVALAAELGTDPDNIVGQTNATAALNLVARSLELKPGDQILTTDHEYSALEKTWAFIVRQTGAEVVTVEIPLPLVSEAEFTETVVAGFTDRTRVLYLSHITSPTALLFPIERAVAAARERGIYTVIDGAHTPGHLPLRLDALGADFYAGNCHKWLMSPKGSAFLYVRPELQKLIDPLVVSHGWTADNKVPGVTGPFGNTPFVDQLEMQGTRDPAAWLTVPAALAFRRDHDWAEVARRCQALAQETARRLAARTDLAPLSSPEFCAPQLVAMPIPDCDTLAVHRALMEKYSIEMPVFKWRNRAIARLSVQGYNSPAQMDLLLDALTELLDLEMKATLMA
ncbi:aminotransferase class V-fold PLP-dependent enzyme [Devosia nitrariae]|uniref:Aminotransferase class V n=1 Tax=Devosia nitrariae TaxID=2071872 RepID=A0ABQ5W8M0_9HYPH|nr:aminotransferase class V-fold PLP-dependent enzyme [Devosia nitrariae]GLQ56383.1 aminotransferase class V [Devosia nitrariae]